jgi:hypothetical protein
LQIVPCANPRSATDLREHSSFEEPHKITNIPQDFWSQIVRIGFARALPSLSSVVQLAFAPRVQRGLYQRFRVTDPDENPCFLCVFPFHGLGVSARNQVDEDFLSSQIYPKLFL